MQLFNIYNKNKMRSINISSVPVNNMIFAKQMFVTAPQQVERSNIVEESTPDNSRVRWGPSIWFLFHTLAHKIKSEDFAKLKGDLIDIIKGICNNLPCPTCALHASEYVRKINYNSINSKEDLKLFLFHFHNHVNVRKNVARFSITELEDKYSKANTLNVIRNFIAVFQYKNRSFNMIANDMQRQRQADTFKVWINDNYNSLDM